MFPQGEFFKQSCANTFIFNCMVMMAAPSHLTEIAVIMLVLLGYFTSLEAQRTLCDPAKNFKPLT